MQQQLQPSQPAANLPIPPADNRESSKEAPPKQVALAMDRLGHAARLIADIRLGADRLLEALFVAGQPHQSSKPLNLIIKEESSMRNYLQELRSIGRQLEESGVLNESLRSRINSWGLHMPLVCPDGAVVAYAWKRQLAGQAGASAVDRTKLALKAFTDQKKRFFPHLDDGSVNESPKSKQRVSETPSTSHRKEANDLGTVSDILLGLEKEVKNVKTSTYQRLDWLKRATLLPYSTESLKEQNSSFHSPSKLRQGSVDVAADKIAVIELLFPSVFRAVISLHPAGSVDPDAVAFFSPDEGGSYIHARGFSVHHVYRHMTEHATTALQYFIGTDAETTLNSLLKWICGYETLFSKLCGKCGRLLSMDKQSALFLPPVCRLYRNFSVTRNSQSPSSKDQSFVAIQAYHIGCFPDDA
jgi:mediator of RNA polymerase II transcription subunit 27